MRYPSIKTIKTRLNWLGKVGDPDELAKQVRAVIEDSSKSVYSKLELLNECLQCFGVEYARHKNDSFFWASEGLEYLNTGDTYTPTIIFDHRLGSWRIESLGDVVERFPNLYP